MKKLNSKSHRHLLLQRETLRTLAKHELNSAAGGVQMENCTAVTYLASGCASAVADPDAA